MSETLDRPTGRDRGSKAYAAPQPPQPRWRHLWLAAGLLVLSIAASIAVIAFGGSDEIGRLLLNLAERIDRHRTLALGLFMLWALAANCIVIPAGSVSLIAAGFVLGPLLPALIWYAAQLVTAPLPHALGRALIKQSSQRWLGGRSIEQWTAPVRQQVAGLVSERPVSASVLLRLCPLVPSAVAALIASGMGIGLRPFLLGSALVGWARPLYFASAGAGIKVLAEPGALSGAAGLLPLVALFTTTLLIVGGHAWLARRPSR